MSRTNGIRSVALSLMLLSSIICLAFAKEPKMDPKDLVARHLQSLGAKEKVAGMKSCVAEGNATLRMLTGGSGQLAGPAALYSDGPKVGFLIKFGFVDYPEEHYVFDGDKFEAGFLKPGVRSRLGAFLTTYSSIVKEGLLGGALTTAWPLNDLEKRNPKLQYDGTKKIEGKELHELRYVVRKGNSDLNTFLYFDPETFRHVASLYRVVIPAQIGPGGPNDSAGQIETRYELEEKFDSFREVNGLTLPTRWRIHFTSTTPRGTTLAEWDMNYDKISTNQPIDPKVFALP